MHIRWKDMGMTDKRSDVSDEGTLLSEKEIQKKKEQGSEVVGYKENSSEPGTVKHRSEGNVPESAKRTEVKTHPGEKKKPRPDRERKERPEGKRKERPERERKENPERKKNPPPEGTRKKRHDMAGNNGKSENHNGRGRTSDARRLKARAQEESGSSQSQKKRAANKAEAQAGGKSGSSGQQNHSIKKNRKVKKANNRISKTIGFVLVGIQLVVSLIFLISLLFLGMLPANYLMIFGGVLAAALLLVLLSQILSKKKGIAGKVFSVFMTVVLGVGSFYGFKASGTVQEISGASIKLDSIVVAVLADDPAETIQDAASYNFGVQYALKGDEIRAAEEAIQSEIGSVVLTTEYKSVQEQAQALHDGNVQAIIYNEAYHGILEEEFPEYDENVKIIYSYSIESRIENPAEDIEVKNESFTVYISGIDVYGAIETNSRSDVNIVAVVNPVSHQILLITTPRDYYIEIPGITGRQRDKLTHAGIYGVDASMAALSQLYGIQIDFYARVNFTSLVEIVNALGGIDVYSEQAFTTSEDSGLVMDVVQGENHFNGQQALAFSRERQNVEGGDFQRGRNQQAVITAMIRKAISPAILMGANGILNSVSGNVDTNMSSGQIQTLIRDQLSQGAGWSIKSMSADGSVTSGVCYSIPGSELSIIEPDTASVEAIQAAIQAVENGETLQDSELAQ